MEKEFCTYEQALALKELGFDEKSLAYWFNETPLNPEGQCLVYYQKPYDNTKITNGVIREYSWAPLYQQAFRWFREKYDLQYWLNDGGMLSKCFIKITGYKHDKFYFSSSEPMEYEEAEDACLDKLIEIVKNK